MNADERELHRALGNLVVNAIRHTPADGVVDVSVRSDDGEAVLSVTDACGGIPEDDLPHVFEVAWRGQPARTPGPDGGAGLGLAIARGIVEAHDGEIEVRNVDGGCRCAPARYRLAAGYGRASNTRLNGVSAARRNPMKPACETTLRIALSPAWAPRAVPPSCDSALHRYCPESDFTTPHGFHLEWNRTGLVDMI